jgi:hypothetical protein
VTRVILVFLLLLVPACATSGKPFDISRANQLRPGISTESDAKSLFGDPVSMQSNPTNNHELLRWIYVHASPVGARGDALAISFDENGKMLKIVERSQI